MQAGWQKPMAFNLTAGFTYVLSILCRNKGMRVYFSSLAYWACGEIH